ncbi:MAG: hypothetical protein NTW94_08450 [Legionellales bacterium]|nr:hypothetical protein [Legionellales bacterium]
MNNTRTDLTANEMGFRTMYSSVITQHPEFLESLLQYSEINALMKDIRTLCGTDCLEDIIKMKGTTIHNVPINDELIQHVTLVIEQHALHYDACKQWMKVVAP